MTRTTLLARGSLGLATAVAAAFALIAGIGSTVATAAPSAEATIKARQAGFKRMGGSMKVLKDQLASGRIDKAAAVAAARTIAGASRQQPGLFPAGTGASSGVKTDALPAIWSDRAGFAAEWTKFQSAADRMVAAAGTGNADTIGAQFKALGATCGSCHKKFRADD